jgi:tripeptide aminopeptidase
VKKFGADFAYTLDGGELGELEYNTFNAASARVTIQGKIVHPGYAKNIMKNAILIGMELQAMLPENERPAFTSGW